MKPINDNIIQHTQKAEKTKLQQEIEEREQELAELKKQK
jgi:hypothetical protein